MALNPSAEKIQNVIKDLGYGNQVIEYSQITRTAQEAADAIGCSVGQIAKSLIFKDKNTEQPILVIASGLNRVNEKTVARYLNSRLERADADFVRTHTGFAIGGVPPIGHLTDMQIFIDEDLLSYEKIWAAAGTPNAVFELKPNELTEMTRGKVVSIK